MVGKYGVPGINEKRESLIEMCADIGMIVGRTCFQKKDDIGIHECERMVIKNSMIVLVESMPKERCKDVMVRMGEDGRMSDHYLEEVKVTVCGHRVNVATGECKIVIKVSEFEKREVRDAYKQMIAEDWERITTKTVGTEEEWMLCKNKRVR